MSRWSPADVRRAQLASKESGLHRAGRPRSEFPLRYQVRHTEPQMAAWQAAARADDRELQNWIRHTLDEAARKLAAADASVPPHPTPPRPLLADAGGVTIRA